MSEEEMEIQEVEEPEVVEAPDTSPPEEQGDEQPDDQEDGQEDVGQPEE
jgi:hypothetical protein